MSQNYSRAECNLITESQKSMDDETTPDDDESPTTIEARTIDEIRARLVNGESATDLAEEIGISRADLFRLARGDFDGGSEGTPETPSISYDPESKEWGSPDWEDPTPEPYTYSDGKLWVPSWQIQPWAGYSSLSENGSETDTQQSDMKTVTSDAKADSSGASAMGNGETVAGTSEDDFGEVRTENWPTSVDPSDLNTELQKEIIQAAAMHRDWNPSTIARRVNCTSGTVSKVLRTYWPDRAPEKSNRGRNPTLTLDDIDEIRVALVRGSTIGDLTDEYDVTASTIRNAANGTANYMNDASVPAVEYHGGDGWLPKDSDADLDLDLDLEPTSEDTDEEFADITEEPAPATIPTTPAVEDNSHVEMVALEYGTDVYHDVDDSGTPACRRASEIGTTILTTVTEAEKVADRCLLCGSHNRTISEIVDEIRDEIGSEPSDTRLSKSELVTILARLNAADVDSEGGDD